MRGDLAVGRGESSLRRLRRAPGRFLRRKIVRVRVDEAAARQTTDERTLDLGCAESRYSRHFPYRVGVDLKLGRSVQVVADAHELPFRGGSFAFAICTEMLEHARDPARVVAEIGRALGAGGRLFLTTRFVFPLHEAPHDYFRFTRFGLEHLFREWVDVEVRPDTRAFEAIAVLIRRMVFQSDLRGGVATTTLLLLLARALPLLDRLVRWEYGDYARSSRSESIITSGYHLTARKPAAVEDDGRCR